MKALIAAMVVTLLAGCAGMGMHDQGSGGDTSMRSGASGDDMGMRYGTRDYNATQDVFHTWVGS